eukprot:3786808-Lingulodinium_polyedra.AAC.1
MDRHRKTEHACSISGFAEKPVVAEQLGRLQKAGAGGWPGRLTSASAPGLPNDDREVINLPQGPGLQFA